MYGLPIVFARVFSVLTIHAHQAGSNLKGGGYAGWGVLKEGLKSQNHWWGRAVILSVR